MPAEFQPIDVLRDNAELDAFLCEDDWPFHRQRRLTPDDIEAMDFSSPDVASFWIVDAGVTVGLVRLLDRSDIKEGATLFDLCIPGRHRGFGYAKWAAQWIVDHLFSSYPELHRIEANTRHHNVAMQRVLSGRGLSHEGRLREAWWSDEGQWFDTMIYGFLRADWTMIGQGPAALRTSHQDCR